MNTDDDDTLKNTFQFSHYTNPRVIESGAGMNNPYFLQLWNPTDRSVCKNSHATTNNQRPDIRKQLATKMSHVLK
jgi:hypothetical protein